LIGQDIAILGDGQVFYYFVSGVAFQPGDEGYTGAMPFPEKFEVEISTVYRYYAASWQMKEISSFNVGGLAVGDYGEFR